MRQSFVVTGGGRGIGRAVVERLLDHGAAVVALDADAPGLAWMRTHPCAERISAVTGDAGSEAVAEQAADAAQRLGALAGWVNNAAVFRDAALDTAPAADVLDLVTANIAPAITGCAVAVRRFQRAGTGGAIVNLSSHQAQRPVAGALPYATAKAAIEGLTRAVAVDHGPQHIRANALALGSVATERYADLLSRQGTEQAARTRRSMAELHPLGRVATPQEVADAVAFLLSDQARFISGAVLPLDGARSVLGRDPEEAAGE